MYGTLTALWYLRGRILPDGGKLSSFDIMTLDDVILCYPRYKRQIQVFATATLQREPPKGTPETDVTDQTETLPRGSFPKWKEEYYKVLSKQKITEEAEYFTDSDREIIRQSTARKRPKSSASYRGSAQNSSRRKVGFVHGVVAFRLEAQCA